MSLLSILSYISYKSHPGACTIKLFITPALPANIRLGGRGLPGTNTLAHNEKP